MNVYHRTVLLNVLTSNWQIHEMLRYCTLKLPENIAFNFAFRLLEISLTTVL